MVHLQHTNPTTKQPDTLEHINNDDVTRILDALEHEMERYNKALELVTDQKHTNYVMLKGSLLKFVKEENLR